MYIGKPFYLKIKINYYIILVLIIAFYRNYFLEVLIGILTVFIHELAHMIVASKYGIKVKEIEIFPFGGVARPEGIFAPDPKEEICICLSGPLINLVLLLCFIVFKNYFLNTHIINILLSTNLLMLLLNILPIFPLDGGKVLRAVLTYFWGYKKATMRMIRLTYFILAIIIIIGLISAFYNYNSLYIVTLSIFIMIAAKNEKKMVAFILITRISRRLKNHKKKKIVKTHFFVCLKNTTVKEVLPYFLPNKYLIIIVIDENGEFIGTITENQLINAILKYDIDINLENLLIKSK